MQFSKYHLVNASFSTIKTSLLKMTSECSRKLDFFKLIILNKLKKKYKQRMPKSNIR